MSHNGLVGWCGRRSNGFIGVVSVIGIALLATACTDKTLEEPPVITGDALTETTSLEMGSTRSSAAPASQPPSTRTLPPEDLALFASEIGARTLVVKPKFLANYRTVVVYKDGESLELETDHLLGGSDGRFIYSGFGEGCCVLSSNAATLDGRVVCEAASGFRIHHATQRNDDTYVMAVEPSRPEEEMQRIGIPHEPTGLIGVPAFAEDCQSGERIPIEPFRLSNPPNEEPRWIQVVRPAGKAFHIGGSSGLVSLASPTGRLLSGEDDVKDLTFNEDASIAVYTDGTGLPFGTENSELMVARDTETGELLWSTNLGEPVLFHHVYQGRVAVGLPGGQLGQELGGVARNNRVVVLDVATGTKITDAFLLETELLYVG